MSYTLFPIFYSSGTMGNAVMYFINHHDSFVTQSFQPDVEIDGTIARSYDDTNEHVTLSDIIGVENNNTDIINRVFPDGRTKMACHILDNGYSHADIYPEVLEHGSVIKPIVIYCEPHLYTVIMERSLAKVKIPPYKYYRDLLNANIELLDSKLGTGNYFVFDLRAWLSCDPMFYQSLIDFLGTNTRSLWIKDVHNIMKMTGVNPERE